MSLKKDMFDFSLPERRKTAREGRSRGARPGQIRDRFVEGAADLMASSAAGKRDSAP